MSGVVSGEVKTGDVSTRFRINPGSKSVDSSSYSDSGTLNSISPSFSDSGTFGIEISFSVSS